MQYQLGIYVYSVHLLSISQKNILLSASLICNIATIIIILYYVLMLCWLHNIIIMIIRLCSLITIIIWCNLAMTTTMQGFIMQL